MNIQIQAFGLGDEVLETSVEVLGGKGGGLVWMDSHGIRVPPGFVIPATLCQEFFKKPKTVLKAIEKEIQPFLKKLQLKFGYMPLVSVRSGSRVSCPGMMDTILNVGLDTDSFSSWAGRLGDDCIRDSYKRLIEMYGSVVKGIDRSKFEGLDVPARISLYERECEQTFPNAAGQLMGAIEAVFNSWNNERAKVYRKLHNIPEEWGTAVVVQAMVFGNLNDQSGTGVLFTRNPDSGEDMITGEFLVNAQGEDVVAGIRTPMPLSKMTEWNDGVAKELIDTVNKLELLKKDVQDVEFTVQDGELFILQTRNAKRSSRAAVKIAVDMYEEMVLSFPEFCERLQYMDYLRAQSSILDPTFKTDPEFTGIPACSGIVSGKVVLSSEDAVKSDGKVILVTQETTPNDIAGMIAARGVLTMTGGATSHAAVVARGMNKPCVVGLSQDLTLFKEGETISIDGATGGVWRGEVPVISGESNPDVAMVHQILRGNSKIKSIGTHSGDVLDLSEFSRGTFQWADDTLVTHVYKALNSVSGKLLVDVRPGDSAAVESFVSMFCLGGEQRVLEVLGNLMDADRLVIISNHQDFAKKVKLQVIGTVSTLEDLVLAEVAYIPSNLPNTEAVAKVLEWKSGQGITRLLVGETEGADGYLTDLQLAYGLLA